MFTGRDLEVIVKAARADARKEAIEECAVLALDFPLNCVKDHHSYRWSDTGKAMAWDIAHAIRKLNGEFAAHDERKGNK